VFTLPSKALEPVITVLHGNSVQKSSTTRVTVINTETLRHVKGIFLVERQEVVNYDDVWGQIRMQDE